MVEEMGGGGTLQQNIFQGKLDENIYEKYRIKKKKKSQLIFTYKIVNVFNWFLPGMSTWACQIVISFIAPDN